MLSTKDVADALRVTTRAVRGWCVDGSIDHITTPGGQYRIPESELKRLMTKAPKND